MAVQIGFFSLLSNFYELFHHHLNLLTKSGILFRFFVLKLRLNAVISQSEIVFENTWPHHCRFNFTP